MKTRLFLCLLLFVVTNSLMAHNPITNGFGPFGFAYTKYPCDNMEWYSFYSMCKKEKYNEKHIGKVRTEHERLNTAHPEFSTAAKCMLGYYLLHADMNHIPLQQEGFELLSEGLKELPDTAKFEGEQRENLKVFMGNIYHQLGWAHLQGVGTDKNSEMAFIYYHMENEYLGKSLPLSLCYLLGVGTPVNEELAKRCCGSVDKHYFSDNLYADIELMLYLPDWNQENEVDSITWSFFREGYLKWHIEQDYEGAHDAFSKAIEKNYLPAMCELGMLYLDKGWKKNDKKKWEDWTQKAVKAGFTPAKHIIGRKYLEHWGTGTPFSSSGEGKAFPYFVEAAKAGYSPSIEILKDYQEGRYSRKTGLTAAFSDLKAGWNSGDENDPGFLEGLLMIGGEMGKRFGYTPSNSNNPAVSSSKVSNPTQPSVTSVATSNNVPTSSNTGEINKYKLQYRNWEQKASYWINSFNEANGWLLANKRNSKTSQMELHNRQSSWFTAQKQLKVVLQELQLARSNAARAGGNIPKGTTEMNVEACVSKGYPN